MAAIRFDKVEKRFGGTRVIRDLNLTVADREFFTFVGPSGCGKSTVLNLIAGLEEVSAGSLSFGERLMNGVPPGERDVAMVFQNYALYPHMSVYENIAFPLKVRKTDRQEVDREVRRVAANLGLTELLARRPKALSGGQRQRVALGRALVRHPQVFLMDEPLSNLDARLRLETREELKRLHRDYQVTTVYVTHDQEEAMVLSERIAVMRAGEVRQVGTPEEVYRRPTDLFVAGFIGSPPINLLRHEQATAMESRLGGTGEGGHIVGFRPADVEVRTEPPPAGIEARVQLVEPTGSDLWVVVEWKGTTLKGRGVPDGSFEPGRQVYLHVPPEKVYRFDPASGLRV